MRRLGSPLTLVGTQRASIGTAALTKLHNEDAWNIIIDAGTRFERINEVRLPLEQARAWVEDAFKHCVYVKDASLYGFERYRALEDVGREMYMITGNVMAQPFGVWHHQLHEVEVASDLKYIKVGGIRMRPEHVRQFVMSPDGSFYVVVRKSELRDALKTVIRLTRKARLRMAMAPKVTCDKAGKTHIQYGFDLTVNELARVLRKLQKQGKGEYCTHLTSIETNSYRETIKLAE